MMAALKKVGAVGLGAVSVAQLARLGLPTVVAFFALALLVLAVICWILTSEERCERVSRMLLAVRGNSSALTATPNPPEPAERTAALSRTAAQPAKPRTASAKRP